MGANGDAGTLMIGSAPDSCADLDLVTLCPDSGHVSHCGGDNLALIRDHPSRIGYVHLKQVTLKYLNSCRLPV
jgi:hypothetical protein